MSLQRLGKLLLLGSIHDFLALEQLGDRPALLAVETEDQGGGQAALALPAKHQFQLLVQQLVADPLIGQRHLSLVALDQSQPAIVAGGQPMGELPGIAHCC